MTKKKKSATSKVEPAEQIEPEPVEELPIRQIEEPIEQPMEPELVAQAESTPIVEPEPAPAEVATKPELPSKPKPLTMSSLHSELDALRQVVDQQGLLIKQLMETPARQRKPPTSNGKIQIKDTKTGKIYPSKNNVYQSLLKTGELKELVDAGVFGPIPEKNSFGCYALFRAYPDRFVEVHEQEQSV